MSYQSLVPLIKKVGSSLNPKDFQAVINIVFHNYEASIYDEMHADMKNSLQQQIDLLITDYLINNPKNKLIKMMDIGCGTGMSSELILKSKISENISHLTLVDTSPKMLEIAHEKAKDWNINYQILNNEIYDIHEKFDIIIVCSVLHHIPLLDPFLKKIDDLLNSNGIFIHLQDPNGDCLNSNIYQNRVQEFKKNKVKDYNFNFKNLIPKSIKKIISRILGRKTYIDLINDELLAKKVIKKRLTADEIWSVTDIHVGTRNSSENKGISYNYLEDKLQNFKNISHISYGFFGPLVTDLDINFAGKEQELITKKDLSGRNIARLWQKN